jgi:hypothetical protein
MVFEMGFNVLSRGEDLEAYRAVLEDEMTYKAKDAS